MEMDQTMEVLSHILTGSHCEHPDMTVSYVNLNLAVASGNATLIWLSVYHF